MNTCEWLILFICGMLSICIIAPLLSTLLLILDNDIRDDFKNEILKTKFGKLLINFFNNFWK